MRLLMLIPLVLLAAMCVACFGSARATAVASVFDGVRANDVAVVMQAIDAGGAVDARDDAGMTPLLHAVVGGQLELVRLLLSRGAVWEVQDAQHYDAMDYAMERNRYEVALLLLETQATRVTRSAADHAALQASLAGQPLLGSEPLSAPLAASLLLLGAARGDGDAVKALLSQGVSADAGIAHGYSALAMAARWNREAVVTPLLAVGADANAHTRSRYATTALMEASRDGQVAIAKQLIAAGARVNEPDKHGDHALNWAAYFGHADFVALMVEHGADLQRTGQTDDQPIEIAIREKHQDVIRILAAAGAVARPGKSAH